MIGGSRKEIQKSAPIFVKNFPRNNTVSKLRKRCIAWGTVVDVFTSKRLTKSDKSFGFVRFFKVVSVTDLINNLRTIWFGNFHLFTDVVRFERNNTKSDVKIDYHKTVDSSRSQKIGKSYVEALSGNKKEEYVVKDLKLVIINNDDCMKGLDSQNCVLEKVNDVDVIRTLFHLMRLEGYNEAGTHYVGGKWVWIEMESKERVMLLKQSVTLNKVFMEFKQVTSDFVPDERFVWLDFVGLPLASWSSNVFKKIGGLWGNSVFVDLNCDGPMSHGKVSVLTRCMSRIDETVRVLVHGNSYEILVKEFAYWAPCFEKVDEESNEISSSVNEADGKSLEGEDKAIETREEV